MASDMEKLKALIDVYVTDIETAREALAIALHAYHANQARLLRPSDGEVVRWVLPGHGFRAPAPVSINSDASRHRGSHAETSFMKKLQTSSSPHTPEAPIEHDSPSFYDSPLRREALLKRRQANQGN